MSVQALTWAFDQNVGPTLKLVLVALANYADDTGQCWPGQGTIARHANVSERSVRRHLKALEELGFITRELRQQTSGRGRATDLYTINFDAVHDQPANLSADNSGATNRPIVSGTYKAGTKENRKKEDKTPARGSRLPDDWTPDVAEIDFATENGLSMDQAFDQADRFRDYWHSQPGQKGVKLDWLATWRNWIRNSKDFANARNRNTGKTAPDRGRGSPQSRVLDAFLQVAAEGTD